MIDRRTMLLRALCAGAVPLSCTNLAKAAGDPGRTMLLAINEAATENVSIADLFVRYEPLAKRLALATHATVRPDPMIDISLFNEQLQKRPAEFIFAKTVDVLAREVAERRYVALAKRDEPYVAGLVAAPGFTGQRLSDLRGELVLFPPADTLTARLGFKALKSRGIDYQVTDDNTPMRLSKSVTIRHVASNDVITSIVGNSSLSWYAAGLLNPSALKKWRGRVLQRLDPQTNWSVAARADLPATVIATASALLTTLQDDAEGLQTLARVGVKRFVPATRQEYVDLVEYLS